jgi:replicative DNA helicase
MSKRLYTYLAFPGKGKSTILLKSALDIRRYNKGIVTKDQDKRPAVLFLTLENDIAETVERIYNMTVDTDDIRNYSEKQIKKKLKKDGHLELTSDDNIDIIIKEYRNRELDTNDLYGIINDLADEGVEVITLIVDYMKRIRPAERASDEKGELKNISNELKELAKFFDIPVNKIAA